MAKREKTVFAGITEAFMGHIVPGAKAIKSAAAMVNHTQLMQVKPSPYPIKIDDSYKD